MNETYTLGYDQAAMAFVERRRLEINGAFFLPCLADLMAWQLDSNGFAVEAHGLREWAARPTGMFAEAWVECAGRKPCAAE